MKMVQRRNGLPAHFSGKRERAMGIVGIHLGPLASENVTICAWLKSLNGNSHITSPVVCATTLCHTCIGSIENFQPHDSPLFDLHAPRFKITRQNP
ncbi:MAG: hypothetical protein ACMUJM_24675 [bacterium]